MIDVPRYRPPVRDNCLAIGPSFAERSVIRAAPVQAAPVVHNAKDCIADTSRTAGCGAAAGACSSPASPTAPISNRVLNGRAARTYWGGG